LLKLKDIQLMKRLLILLLICTLFSGVANAQSSQCSLAPRLEIGSRARVISGNIMNLRQSPTTSGVITWQIPAGAAFDVLDGPRCDDGYNWWQMNYAGNMGWVAEGDPAAREYWLEPLAGIPVVSPPEDFIDTTGCQLPPDDYTRITIGSAEFNARTLAMLDHAQSLYEAAGGTIVFRQAITQGGYNNGFVSASFGTHDGGGAVDLSVRSPADFSIQTDQIPLMIRALRVAGFAAWLREGDELYAGSPIHIHAIAIGDLELSPAAREQIDGTFGYLRGYGGLPRDDGIPQPDRSGELVLCQWMIDQGFTDLRGS
jgi:hypothetical protein